MKLASKIALVTGGSRGIGAAIAIELAREGCDVAVNYATHSERAEEVVNQILELGRKAVAVQADVSDHDQVQRMMARTVEELGDIDILVNNAGIIRRGSSVEHTLEEWERVLRVNLWGTFNCSKEVVPRMLERGRGKIVNISSIAGKVGDVASAPSYGSSKGAMNALTKSLARELAPHGINVNAIAPHAIETEMSAEWPDEKRRQIVSEIPLRRLGQPEEVAAAVVFLASEGAGFITGEILDINGGYLMD